MALYFAVLRALDDYNLVLPIAVYFVDIFVADVTHHAVGDTTVADLFH